MDTKFLTANGRLTAYALGCGYIEQKSTNLDKLRKEDIYTQLYMEHGHYHVRSFDFREGVTQFRSLWRVFAQSELTAARELFDAQPGELIQNKG